MANIKPSDRTHGVFSTYPARLKHSNDNALLLPESYLTNKRTRFAGSESDDDFYVDESDEDEEGNKEREEEDKKRSVNKSNQNGQTRPDWPKITRKKNNLYYSDLDLTKISEIEEILVPVRLDIDIDSIRLRDRFLWNMNEQYLTPEKFAEMLCEDLELPQYKFVQPIADSIRSQVLDFESVNTIQLPKTHARVLIKLDLQIGKVNYKDQFEWDLQNDNTNAPEVFSRQLAAELGVGGEYVGIISHAIREQLFRHKKQYVEELMIEGEIRSALDNVYRPMDETKHWEPQIETLSNDELEKLLISQERNIRRMRRETRFKRSTRRISNY
ncbi:SNF5-domain-containing protein [Rhizopus microsporus var. microsporus]|nr:SNF5-domain-containing protein [Rhizopus microsporus var. microsporus]